MTLTGPTPILDAVYRGVTPALARLLDTGTRPTLFEAAAVGDASLVKRLAAESPSAVATRSPDGWPPLHLAAHFAHGAVDGPNHEGKTALQVAEERSHTAIARRLRGELP